MWPGKVDLHCSFDPSQGGSILGRVQKEEKFGGQKCKSNFWGGGGKQDMTQTSLTPSVAKIVSYAVARIVYRLAPGVGRWGRVRTGNRVGSTNVMERNSNIPLCAKTLLLPWCALQRLWRPVRTWGGGALTVTFFFSGCQVGDGLRLAFFRYIRSFLFFFFGRPWVYTTTVFTQSVTHNWEGAARSATMRAGWLQTYIADRRRLSNKVCPSAVRSWTTTTGLLPSTFYLSYLS